MRKIWMGKIVAAITQGAFWPICSALIALSSETLAETATPITDGWRNLRLSASLMRPSRQFIRTLKRTLWIYRCVPCGSPGQTGLRAVLRARLPIDLSTNAPDTGRKRPQRTYNYFNPWWHPYYHNTALHSMQSVTKSVVSALVGIALSQGKFPISSHPVLSSSTKQSSTLMGKRDITLRKSAT